MVQEEVRLSLEQADEKTEPISTFGFTERREWKEMRDCFTCGEKREAGHLKWNCPTRDTCRGHYRGGSSRIVGGRGGYLGR